MTAPRIERLPLKAITLDPRAQLRIEQNPDVVDDYADAMERGETFPPVVVFFDGVEYWLADGFHRWWATSACSRDEIDAEVRDGTLRDAILYACRANASHGLPRSKADKRRAVETMLADEEWAAWSDREIARRCLVSHTFVANARREASGNDARCERRYVTKHGSEAVMNTIRIGLTGNVAGDTEGTVAGNESATLPPPPQSLTATVPSSGPSIAAPLGRAVAAENAVAALVEASARALRAAHEALKSPEDAAFLFNALEHAVPTLKRRTDELARLMDRAERAREMTDGEDAA